METARTEIDTYLHSLSLHGARPISGTAARGHRDGYEQARDDDAEEQRSQGGEALLASADLGDHEKDNDRRQHGKQAGNDHFLDRRAGDNVDGAGRSEEHTSELQSIMRQ